MVYFGLEHAHSADSPFVLEDDHVENVVSMLQERLVEVVVEQVVESMPLPKVADAFEGLWLWLLSIPSPSRPMFLTPAFVVEVAAI